MIKIIDNFLDVSVLNNIKNIINTDDYDWCLWKQANSNSTEGQFQFAHVYMNDNVIIKNMDDNIINFIMQKYTNDTNKNLTICRARVNLFLKTKTNLGFGYHVDIYDSNDFSTLLLYLEDSNGCTEFKNGQKIQSKENRAIIFPANVEHQTVSHTDIQFRTNININFMEIK